MHLKKPIQVTKRCRQCNGLDEQKTVELLQKLYRDGRRKEQPTMHNRIE